MRQIVMMGCLLSLLLGPVALVDAFQVCWRLHDGAGTPLLDVVRMAATQLVSNPQIFALHGDVTAAPLYQQGGGGMATPNAADGSQYRVALTLTHDTSSFNGNRTCGLTLVIVADHTEEDFLDGTWSEQCAGGPTAPTNVSGLVISFNCPASVSSVAQDQEDVSAREHQAFGIMQSRKPGIAQEDLLAQQINAFGEYRAAGCVPGLPCLPE